MKKKIGLLLLLLIAVVTCVVAITSVNAFAADTVTVSFYLDDQESNLYATESVAVGSYASIPITPVKNGSVFQYWKDKDSGEKFSFATQITENTTLIAQWDERTVYHTVTFKVDGEAVSTQEVEHGTGAIAPASPAVPAGKKFVSWIEDYSAVTGDTVINAELTDKEYKIEIIGFDGTVIDDSMSVVHGDDIDLTSFTPPQIPNYSFSGYDGELSSITADTKIHLVYEPDSYDVIFMSDGSQFGDVGSVDYGTTVPFPKNVPSKENHIFIGWYTEETEGAMYTFNEEVAGDITLYARFIPIENPKFLVTFHTHDGTQYGGIQEVEQGASAIEPGEPYREGYTFVRWSVDFSNVTKDIDVYPIYSVNKYTVTITDAEGTLRTVTDVNYGTDISEPELGEIRVPVGQEFVCWDRSFKKITGDTTITAIYRAKTYAVMFYNSDMQKLGVTQYIKHGKSAKAPVMGDMAGYTFKGWRASDGMTPSCITDDCTFIADYERNKYTVSFWEENEKITDVDVYYGDKVNIHTYEKSGFIFGGWYTESSLDNRYDFNTSVEKSIDLYAKWEKEPDRFYTVTFMANDESWNRQKVIENGAVMMPANPTKTGYTFKGWKDIATGAEAVLDGIDADMTVVAVFEVNTYTVRFYTDDVNYIESTVEYGASAVAPSENPEKEGYDFDGWNKSFTSITENTDIKPLWRLKSFKVTFYDGSGVLSEQTVQYGSFVTMISTPVKSGYTFERWVDESGEMFAFGTPIVGDTSVFASFRANSYDIYYYLDGVLYRTVSCEYGASITPIEAPSFNDPNVEFLGWSALPDTMPSNHLVVMGTTYTYRSYDVIYYVDGTEFHRVSVREGDTVPSMSLVPENLPEHIEFIGWQTAPATMPAHDVRVDANIKIYRYYNVNYYANGLFFKSVSVMEGREIPEFDEVPTNLPGNIKFVSWGEAPAVMPSSDVRVDANVRLLQHFNIDYYVNGTYYMTVSALEGERFPESPAEPTELPENVVFLSWGNLPDIMPSEDVRIDAEVRVLKYYTVTYYLYEGKPYKSLEVLEGAQIPRLDAPTGLPESMIFKGWGQAPAVMPSENVDIYADIETLSYYTVSYYVNGKLYTSVKVLEGKPIPEMAPPTLDDSSIVFIGWGNAPSTMPSEDVRIDAEVIILEKYKVNYFINGNLYMSVEWVEGAAIAPISPPVLKENEVFSGWGEFPSVMPSHDIDVHGTISAAAANAVKLDKRIEGDVLYLELWVEQDVEFASILASVELGGRLEVLSGYTEDDAGEFHIDENGTLRVVWAKGENATDDVLVLKLLLRISDGVALEQIGELMVDGMLVFDENGDIVSANYTVVK